MNEGRLTRRDFIRAGTMALGAASLTASPARAMAEDTGMNVRFGLNLLVYTAAFSKDQIDLIPKVAEMGFDGVEVPLNDLSVLDPAATNAARERAGMGLTTCAVLLPGANLTSVDPAERQKGIAQLRRIVDVTAEMGGEAVAGPIYAPVGELTGRARTEDEWKWGVEGLRAAGEHAQKAGLLMAVEPLNRFETHFLNTAADAVRLTRAIDLPNVKVQLDTFHCNIEEKDTAAAIRATGALLGHFHASESDRGVPGTGQVKWDDCFAALRDINYSGWITIESFATGILELCAAACIWRPIYDSADGLARDGLAFLKAKAGGA